MDMFNFSDLNNTHVLINLILVKHGVRTATLIESSNLKWSSEKTKYMFLKFMNKWNQDPNCGSRFEVDENGPSNRLLVYNKNRVKRLNININGNIEDKIGILLDFVCPNEIYSKKTKYTISIYGKTKHILNNKMFEIRTEICVSDFKKLEPIIKKIVENYTNCLKKYFSDINITYVKKIKYDIPLLLHLLDKSISDITILEKNIKKELSNEFDNNSFFVTRNEILKIDNKNIKKNHIILWKTILLYIKNDPIQIFYPISLEQNEEMEKYIKKFEYDLRTFYLKKLVL